jgi:hypothetical protein
LYSSPNIIRMIKLRRMGWTGHVARMGKRGLRIGFNEKSRRKENSKKTLT